MKGNGRFWWIISLTTQRLATWSPGGVRKLRWGLEGRGKRGGARVIYFHHDAGMPLFALTAFAKNEQADLSQQDRNDFRQLTTLLVEVFKRRKP
jgi:hypothetical protein